MTESGYKQPIIGAASFGVGLAVFLAVFLSDEVIARYWPPQLQFGPASASASDQTSAQIATLPLLEAEALNPAFLIPQTPARLSVLSESDAQTYRRIFTAQAAGRMAEADRLVASLSDRRVMGHVLFQRYLHPTAWRSSYTELHSWMRHYADHPEAERIYQLALRRKPDSVVEPVAPITATGLVGALEDYGYTRRWGLYTQQAETLADQIARLYRDGQFMEARRLYRLNQNRFDLPPQAAWLSGLSSWQLRDYAAALSAFEKVAEDDNASPWLRAAGHYWAARIYSKRGDTRQTTLSWHRAAVYTHSFYGLLAAANLGQKPDMNWHLPAIEERHVAALKAHESGYRALALLQIGETRRAAAELRRIHPRGDRALEEALVLLASHTELPDIALRTASAVVNERGYRLDAALYPRAPWQPQGGEKLESALLHAFMRQESRFDPLAESRSGARGLMQLMPTTANYISNNGRDYTGTDARYLFRPDYNLALGQDYLLYLLDKPEVQDNLLYLAIAYNAGPGNLRRWARDRAEMVADPLLFMESLPSAETRNFTKRVLTNYWIYSLREGIDPASLSALAAGKPALYQREMRAALTTHPEN